MGADTVLPGLPPSFPSQPNGSWISTLPRIFADPTQACSIYALQIAVPRSTRHTACRSQD